MTVFTMLLSIEALVGRALLFILLPSRYYEWTLVAFVARPTGGNPGGALFTQCRWRMVVCFGNVREAWYYYFSLLLPLEKVHVLCQLLN
jgi:hypothetical protein